MTGTHKDADRRLMTDGGTDAARTVTKTATADGVVTRDVDGEEQDLLRIPISSTRADREGDRFTKDALEQMADQIATENPMVFDNHGLAGSWMDAIPYDSRETIGAQMDAELESAEDGEFDLFALVNPDGTHPEGERMLKQVREEGQPIKFSVGFRVLDYDAIEDDAGNEIGREFTRSDLMETSRVGIPANPDASVTQSMAAKGGPSGGLPGVQNHPMMAMMQAMGGGVPEQADAAPGIAAKDGKGPVNSDTVEDGTPVDVDGDAEPTERDAETESESELRDELAELRSEVAELTKAVKEDDDDEDGDDDEDEDEDDDKDTCEVDTDCPEGEVCLEGECVPEDEVGDDEEDAADPDETDDGDVPETVKELREENKALREEVSEVRDILEDGRGDSATGDTDMSERDITREDDDADTDDSTEQKTAMDIARES